MATSTLVHKAVSREYGAISPEADVNEVLVVCPKCKTMETMLFGSGHFFVNRKFTETEAGVFHNCGSKVPCRVYQSGKAAV